ncbi:hypothetical protein SCP_0300620 [Sparassis crispa]|uniref:Uncharacterized protein n=1 Tax=Sparassis crispa TaxID=139825 RepID=A0A401GDV7_9APHY|nr:hypothetical protein SCP_0300620 [Sparassis crispa]GBE80347.1 hypothetical protein SCP_0300620 [Sparassis crispa]
MKSSRIRRRQISSSLADEPQVELLGGDVVETTFGGHNEGRPIDPLEDWIMSDPDDPTRDGALTDEETADDDAVTGVGMDDAQDGGSQDADEQNTVRLSLLFLGAS